MSEHKHEAHHTQEHCVVDQAAPQPTNPETPAQQEENAKSAIEQTIAAMFANPECGKFDGHLLGCLLQGQGPMQLLWVDSRKIDVVVPYNDGRGHDFVSLVVGNLNVLCAISKEVLAKRVGWK